MCNSKGNTLVEFNTGDQFVVLSGGIAGVGNPEDKDPEAVRMDVKNDMFSPEMSRDS